MGQPIGVIHLESDEAISDETVSVVMGIAGQVAIAIANARLITTMESLAMTDGLTGLRNARYFDNYLEQELAAAERDREPLCVLMLDIDNFKAFNDTYGHPAGDEALRVFGRVVRSALRSSDVPARYGGEEFVVALRHTDLAGAEVAGEKLRDAVSRAIVEIGPGRYGRMTVSVGVAEADLARIDQKALLSHADSALYRAKADGRNRVVTASAGHDLRTNDGHGADPSEAVGVAGTMHTASPVAIDGRRGRHGKSGDLVPPAARVRSFGPGHLANGRPSRPTDPRAPTCRGEGLVAAQRPETGIQRIGAEPAPQQRDLALQQVGELHEPQLRCRHLEQALPADRLHLHDRAHQVGQNGWVVRDRQALGGFVEGDVAGRPGIARRCGTLRIVVRGCVQRGDDHRGSQVQTRSLLAASWRRERRRARLIALGRLPAPSLIPTRAVFDLQQLQVADEQPDDTLAQQPRPRGLAEYLVHGRDGPDEVRFSARVDGLEVEPLGSERHEVVAAVRM